MRAHTHNAEVSPLTGNPPFLFPRSTRNGAACSHPHFPSLSSQENLTDYFAENYKKWGCVLEFVTNRSQEGSQFCRGFGGIGGVLRYLVNTTEFEDDYGDDEFDEKSSDGWATSDSDI